MDHDFLDNILVVLVVVCTGVEWWVDMEVG